MTVIAWDGEAMAADKLADYGGLKNTTTKIRRIRGHLVGFAGDLDRMLELVDWFEKGAKREDFPTFAKADQTAGTLLVITPGGDVMQYERGPLPVRLNQVRAAIGSGREFAMGAMHMGASAAQAVEAACALCTSCGNGVDIIELEL